MGDKVVSEAGGMAEVRYETAAEAQTALAELQGTNCGADGASGMLSLDPKSQDGTKIMIANMPAGLEWQGLKDHFGKAGKVAYAAILGPGEVRFETKEIASTAVTMMNGHSVEEMTLSVRLDPASQDGTKVIVD